MRSHWFPLYCRIAAGALVAFVVTLQLFVEAPSPVMAKGVEEKPTTVAPRIAAWLERVAEEKLHEEKLARLAALPEPPVPREVQRSIGKQIESRMRAVEKEAKAAGVQREKQLAAEKRAKQLAARRPLQQEPFMALGYAPQQSGGPFGNMSSVQRDPRLPF